MNYDIIQKIIIVAYCLVALYAAVISLRMIKNHRQPMALVFFAFSMISLLMSNLYWFAYDLIGIDSRMPFAANEIGEWSCFLLVAAAISTVFKKERTAAIKEIVFTLIFAAACTALWIGWSGEWVQDIISGLVFGYWFCIIINALKSSDVLNSGEWAVLAVVAMLIAGMEGATFFTSGAAKNNLDICCYILMFASIAVFYIKLAYTWRKGESITSKNQASGAGSTPDGMSSVPDEMGSASDETGSASNEMGSASDEMGSTSDEMGSTSKNMKLLSLSFAMFAWSTNCMYMSADPMYCVFEISAIVALFIAAILFRRVEWHRERGAF